MPQATTKEANQLMLQGALALSKVQSNGIRVDLEHCQKLNQEIDNTILEIEEKFNSTRGGKIWRAQYGAEYNRNSEQQLSWMLYKRLKFACPKLTTTGKASTDVNTLEELYESTGSDFIKYLMQLRKLEKAKNTYLAGLLREVSPDGFLHPFFHLHKARSFRSSSSSPNFQNFPIRDPEVKKYIRSALCPRKGRQLLEMDYSGIEVRIAHCLTKETKIETIDGSQTIIEIINRLSKGENVYVFSQGEKQLTVKKVLWGGKTGFNQPIYKVTLDNGEIVRCTGNHQFMLRNGLYQEAKDLVIGQSLMPFYKKIHHNYMFVQLNNKGKDIEAHRLIAQEVLGVELKKGVCIHHRDENKLNNSLDNLEPTTRSKHTRMHCLGKKYTEERKTNISKGRKGKGVGRCAWNKGYTKDTHPGVAKISASKLGKPSPFKGKKGEPWTEEQKEAQRQKILGKKHTEEICRKISEKKKEYWANAPLRQCPYCGKFFRTITNTHLKKCCQNHKVISVERDGYADVYDITVECTHNFALSAGCIVHNCYHKDPTMRSYLLDSTKDMHRDMCKQLYILKDDEWNKACRQGAKNKFVFPEFYGSFYKTVAPALWKYAILNKLTTNQGVDIISHLQSKGIQTIEQYTEYVKKIEDDFWYKRFPIYTKWKNKFWEDYIEKGYFDSLTGFRFHGVYKKNEVINYPVQGAAFHCLLWTLIQLQAFLERHKMKSLIVGQIHDSMVLDIVPEELGDILFYTHKLVSRKLSQHFPWITIPMYIEAELADIDQPWYYKKEIDINQFI